LIEPLRLVVRTPAETLLDSSPVQQIHLRLADGGGLGIYPGHAPLLAETAGGAITYVDEGGEQTLELEAGILQITPAAVLILVPGAWSQAEPSASAEAQAQRERRFKRLAATLLEMLREEPELTGEEVA
jgi:F0F1-type ATP synthase epsilon subunit